MKSFSPDLRKVWDALKAADAKVNLASERVAKSLAPREPEGRELPFFVEKTFTFPLYDFEPRESPVVMSAGQVTRITRMSYLVWRGPNGSPGARSANVAAFFDDFSGGTGNDSSVNMFDFEWSLSIGSTQRRYTNGRGNSGYNSRQSLGNPEALGWLLFSEKNPLKLGTNEFLNFKIRPTLYNMDPNYAAQFGSVVMYVAVKAEGFRTYGR